MKASGAYVYFCDDNGLKRIDATPAEHMANLELMVVAMQQLIEMYRAQQEVKVVYLYHSEYRGWTLYLAAADGFIAQRDSDEFEVRGKTLKEVRRIIRGHANDQTQRDRG